MAESILGSPSTSPFVPHFGVSSPLLSGRETLLRDLGDGLVTGPTDKRYTSILMGVRGSGKTVALNEIEARAASAGWVVLSMDGGSVGLLGRITETIQTAPETYQSLRLDGTTRKTVGKSFGLRLGPLEGHISSIVENPSHAPIGLRQQLTKLTEAARRNDAAVLLTIDELHAIDRDEGRRLSNDLQHITKRAKMPLAFVGAGLLELKHTLLQDNKMTFFHRCENYDMRPLTFSDAYTALSAPIKAAGGSITDDALSRLSDAATDSPYKLQLIGDLAWKIAGAPEATIDGESVSRAIAGAERDLESPHSFASLVRSLRYRSADYGRCRTK